MFQDGGSSDGRDGGDGARGENLMDITGAPGYEYLSPSERLLCSQLHMTPGPYLAIKVGADLCFVSETQIRDLRRRKTFMNC